VWQALPTKPDTPGRLLMARLAGRAPALHDSIARVDWPNGRQLDDRLGAIADTFIDVAGVLRSHPQALEALEVEQVRTAVRDHGPTAYPATSVERGLAAALASLGGTPTGRWAVRLVWEAVPVVRRSPAPWFEAPSRTGLCRLVSGPEAFNPLGSCH